LTDGDAADGLADQMRSQTAPGGFNFG